MATRTEEALNALFEALTEAAAASPEKLPTPSRGETLPTQLTAFRDGVTGFLNILDGTGGPEGADGGAGATLGADVTEDGYEIVQRAELEWIVEANERATRDLCFDDGLIAINAKLKADRTLAGAVNDVRIEKIERSNLAIDGLPNLKGAIITIALSFLSSDPF